ncbi:hypothetical protein MC885_006625 [Smutsia gigantea]|nr:hypothetical protein MC885_006625 [Smutsia gigantea]
MPIPSCFPRLPTVLLSLVPDAPGELGLLKRGKIRPRPTCGKGLAQLCGKKKAAALFDSQAPICPICQVLLRPSELQEHMEQELEQLAQLPTRFQSFQLNGAAFLFLLYFWRWEKHDPSPYFRPQPQKGTRESGKGMSHCHRPCTAMLSLTASKNSLLKDAMAPGTPKSLLLSASIKREGESPTASPHSSATDDLHHSDRYQTFLRVRANRQTRLNARIGKMKRRKQDEGQVCPLCNCPLAGSEQEMSRHVERCLSKREGSCMAEDDAVDIEHENSNRFEEYEWCGQKRIRATTLLEGGFRGSGFVMCSGKENPDSDADLDVDGDDTLEYGKPQYPWGTVGQGSVVLDHHARYTEADVIPCTGEEPGEAKEREALRGAVLKQVWAQVWAGGTEEWEAPRQGSTQYPPSGLFCLPSGLTFFVLLFPSGGPPSTRITPEFSKWASDAEMPSTSNGESSKQEAMQKTCKNSDIENSPESRQEVLRTFLCRAWTTAVTTFEALKARVRELERQLSRGDRYKCLICMDSYSMPLTSIQCWHVHCEECWLRTLGAKKLCPQCNTITAPGDLRRIYL